MANVLFVPRYKKDLAEGKLFDSTEYQPRRQKYAVDRPAYNSVKKMFTEYGHSVYTADQISLSNVDITIYIDLPRLNTFGLLREISTIEGNMNLIYIMREPPSFLGYNSFFELTKMSSIFDTILTWNNDISSISDDFEHYYIPWNLADKIEAGSYPRLSYNQRDLLTNISGKHTSDYPNELYSERKRVIEYYENNYPEMFSLIVGGKRLTMECPMDR